MSVIIPLEVKTEKELDRAVKIGRTVIIINNDAEPEGGCIY